MMMMMIIWVSYTGANAGEPIRPTLAILNLVNIILIVIIDNPDIANDLQDTAILQQNIFYKVFLLSR